MVIVIRYKNSKKVASIIYKKIAKIKFTLFSSKQYSVLEQFSSLFPYKN